MSRFTPAENGSNTGRGASATESRGHDCRPIAPGTRCRAVCSRGPCATCQRTWCAPCHDSAAVHSRSWSSAGLCVRRMAFHRRPLAWTSDKFFLPKLSETTSCRALQGFRVQSAVFVRVLVSRGSRTVLTYGITVYRRGHTHTHGWQTMGLWPYDSTLEAEARAFAMMTQFMA